MTEEYLRIAEHVARLLSLGSEPLDVDRAWADLETRMTARRAIRWLEVVVGVAALLVFALVTYETVAPVIAAHVDAHYEAAATAPLAVRLPDGSRATLAPLARLEYRASYFRPAREVTLEGEARFFVRADSAHPFVVHAGAATITVQVDSALIITR